MSDSFINLSQTDFEQVKISLTDFIRTKPEFSDYDFTGSAMSTLIDLLAYNTAFFSTYTNFLANESFIDSAQKRDSLMSLARLVGYTPRSRIASRAVLNVTSSSSTLPANTVFTGADTGYSFITLESQILEEVSSGVFGGDVTVYQNSNVLKTVNTTYSFGKVVIPEQADISSLTVSVGGTVYTEANRISALGPASKVFFLDPIFSGAYEVSFGDGTYGESVSDGSDVRVEYLTPNGVNNANGEKSFTSNAVTSITVVSESYGGSERETSESIRRNAPSYFQAQNRAVTANDAEIVFKVDNPQVYDATAWGGEDNNPPQYGRLFLSTIKDAAGTTFSAEELSEFGAKLQEKTVVGILPEFKDRSCYDVNVTSGTLIYDPVINSDGTGLNGLTSTKLIEYDPACSFRGVFPYSTITSELVNENPAIRSIDLDIDISGSFSNETYNNSDVVRNLYISFANSVKKNSLFTDFFFISESLGEPENIGFLDDDGDGFIRLGGVNSGRIFNYRLGTIDYSNGNITILGFSDWDPLKAISDGGTKDLTIHCVPESRAVQAKKQATYKLGTVASIRLSQ